MKIITLCDAGPLVAYIDVSDEHHDWVKRQTQTLSVPFLTCESVLSESWFLLRNVLNGREKLINLIQRKAIIASFQFQEEAFHVTEILAQYANVPASIADACLVRMSELHSNSVVFTLDSDFRIYRKNRNQRIPILSP